MKWVIGPPKVSLSHKNVVSLSEEYEEKSGLVSKTSSMKSYHMGASGSSGSTGSTGSTGSISGSTGSTGWWSSGSIGTTGSVVFLSS